MFIVGAIIGFILAVVITSTIDSLGIYISDDSRLILLWIGAVVGAVCGGYFDIRKWKKDITTSKESIDRSVNLVLNTLEEGANFLKKHSWIIRKIDIMQSESIAIYAYMLVEEGLNLQDVEIMIKEVNFEWEAIDSDDGRIWLRKIATFGRNKGFIYRLKKQIAQKHPDWSVDTSFSGQLYARIWI